MVHYSAEKSARQTDNRMVDKLGTWMDETMVAETADVKDGVLVVLKDV
jgi:hypothetical protein